MWSFSSCSQFGEAVVPLCRLRKSDGFSVAGEAVDPENAGSLILYRFQTGKM
jgi:hypothetical protein